MPYETLIAALLEEGQRKCAEVLSKARTEADRLVAQAQAAASAMDQEAESRTRREVAKHRTRILSQAGLSARHILLKAKHDVLEAVWQRVEETGLALAGETRTRVLLALLEELRSAAPPGPLRAVIHPGERGALAPHLDKGNIPWEARDREDLLLGLELCAPGECLKSSLATRLAKAKPDLLAELNELLFVRTED